MKVGDLVRKKGTKLYGIVLTVPPPKEFRGLYRVWYFCKLRSFWNIKETLEVISESR